MDIQMGDLLIHLEGTPALLLALVPLMVATSLIPSIVKGFRGLRRFGVTSLGTAPVEEVEEE